MKKIKNLGINVLLLCICIGVLVKSCIGGSSIVYCSKCGREINGSDWELERECHISCISRR